MSDWPEVLQGARCRLRKPVPGDAPSLFAQVSGDPEVTRYLGWTTHRDLAQTRRQISYELARWQRSAAHTWVLEDEAGDAAGLVQLIGQGPTLGLGIALARSMWGRGLACAAVAQVTDEAFRHAPVFRVEAMCDADHLRSSRMLQRAGLAFEACLRRSIVHPNLSAEPRDGLMHAKVRA